LSFAGAPAQLFEDTPGFLHVAFAGNFNIGLGRALAALKASAEGILLTARSSGLALSGGGHGATEFLHQLLGRRAGALT
jgi:hypothetical protein